MGSPTSLHQRASEVTNIHVIDGDTVGLNDGGANVRLVGFNTPETGSREIASREGQ